MAQRGFTFVLDARDATNAFKDLEHGFRRSHRAASEFGNILGGLSSEMGGFGKAFGAVGAALASGSAWGAAAAGIMLLVDHFKELGKAAAEGAKKAQEEMTKLYDELFKLQVKSRDREVELQIAGTETMVKIKQAERDALMETAGESSAGMSLYGPDIDKADAAIASLNGKLTTLRAILAQLKQDAADKVAADATKKQAETLAKAESTLREAFGEAWSKGEFPAWDEKLWGEMVGNPAKSEKLATEAVQKLNEAFGEAWSKGEFPIWDEKLWDDMAGNPANQMKQTRLEAEKLRAVGSNLGETFGNLGEAFGGSAGKMLAAMGNLITKAVQLAIAMTATGGPFAWVNLPATLAAITAVIAAVPQFRAGGGYVGAGQPYVVGEAGPELFVPGMNGAIVPNRALGGVTLNINGVVSLDQAWWDREQGKILRTLSKATTNRRRG